MYGYIYITINLINGKRYIGKNKSDNEKNNYLGSGKILKKSINKYGKENFKKEILIKCNTLEELNEYEKYFIKKYNAINRSDFYNIAEGGTGGRTWQNYSEKEKEKSLKKYKGKNSKLYGIPRSEKTKEKIRLGNLGKKRSEETRRRISESQKGEKHHFYGKKRLDHSKRMKGEKHPKAKKILVYDEYMNRIKVFNCIKDCMRFYNIPRVTMYRHLNKDKIHNKTKLYFKTED